MRIMLIQPSDVRSDELTAGYQRHGRLKVLRDGSFRGVIALPPLGLAYLATPLAKAGHEVRLLDAATLKLTRAEMLQEVVDFNAELVGISLYSYFLRNTYLLTQQIKQRLGIPIVLGGPHPSAMPKKVLEEFSEVDCLMKGWGEFSAAELVEYLAGERAPEEVLGLCYRNDDGEVVINAEAELPHDDEAIPRPHRPALQEMYDNHAYFNILSPRKNMDVLMTSRGCRFSCNFCFQHCGYYEHSPDRVMDELHKMVARGVDAVEIMDDSFTLNRKRAHAIIDRIIDEKLDLEFRIRSRANVVNEEMLAKLRKMGCRAINFGMEAGTDKMLKLMNKKCKVEHNERACKLTKKHGILCQSTWVFGFPGETEEDRRETFRFVNKIMPNTFGFYGLAPLPGTQVYNEAKENGTLSTDWSVHDDDVYVKHPDIPDFEDFEQGLEKQQRKMMLSPRFVYQTARYLARNPNLKLATYGLRMLTGRLRRMY